jgi:uncharacterized protein
MSKLCFLLLHGYTGSGLEHWQTWLARRLAARGHEVRFPTLPDPDDPVLDRWLEALSADLATSDPEGLVVLAHSAGALLWIHHAARSDHRTAKRVLLVAPPGPAWSNPAVTGFMPVPLDDEAIRRAAADTRLVAADNDPYAAVADVRRYAMSLRVPLHIIPGGGHLNTDSGHGPWPAVERWALRGGRFE